MAGQLTVDDPGMQAAHNRFDQSHTTYVGIRNNVEGSVQTLRASHKGDASDSFNRRMTTWSDNCQVVLKALADLTVTMQNSLDTYRKHEAQAAVTAAGSGR